MTTRDDKEKLLGILHAHGQQFLRAFDVPSTTEHEVKGSHASEEEEEWTGLGSSPDRHTSETTSDSEHSGLERENDSDGFASSSSRKPGVTVFLEAARKQAAPNLSAKELRKSFMSSKVTNITSSTMQPILKKKMPDDSSDDEHTNTQNDALLHRLVHTKLLSGSLNPELDLNHAQKGRALAGRVLELAGETKLGKGESTFRQKQRNKAAKHVRDGLLRKQREQEQNALEEARNLGNYHPTLKRLYDSNSSSSPKKKRARGLGLGVGKFAGGTLKLSREEIALVTGSVKRTGDNRRQGPR